ncbi:hypothetical protein [Streptomyces prunicolor]|uniref:hypothetical protein n=1 Tax=Streptomyces prunicolor TaxID=67348 RepID=UPI0033D81C09
MKLDYTEVFVPGGHPKHTYNPRHTLSLEKKIRSVKENLCKLVVVTGHTKSGKTVLVRSILPQEEAVWIDGGGVANEEDLWSSIVEALDLFQETHISTATQATGELSGEAALEGGFLVAKGSAKAGAKIGASRGDTNGYSRRVSSKVAALTGLRAAKVPLVLDDFHYLPKTVQGNIVRALKPLIFDGVPVVVIAIPHRRYDSVKVEREMTGRMLSVQVPTWSNEELGYIPETGFKLLRMEFGQDVVDRLVKEAIGSPHLMQEFCRQLCNAPANISEALDNLFRETAENTIGRPIFEKLAQGPRQRSDRKQRTLKEGSTVDIYGLVLEGMAHLKPALVTLEYEDLRAAIKEICLPESIPNVQEVARVLKLMAEISATDESSTPVIDFDEEDKRLHITDPFFAFYLRWGMLSAAH